MSTVCGGCGAWMAPEIDADAETARCPQCGHTERVRLLPLFIVTGASGTGKTAVVPLLRKLLPGWAIFETDVIWDSAGDWHVHRSNWLRIAHALAQSGQPTLLCGTMLPEDVDRCDHRVFFRRVDYLALHCEDGERERRLRARPAWRRCNEEFIAAQRELAAWLVENAESAFDPPLTLVDTTHGGAEVTARAIRDWALARLPEKPSG